MEYEIKTENQWELACARVQLHFPAILDIVVLVQIEKSEVPEVLERGEKVLMRLLTSESYERHCRVRGYSHSDYSIIESLEDAKIPVSIFGGTSPSAYFYRIVEIEPPKKFYTFDDQGAMTIYRLHDDVLYSWRSSKREVEVDAASIVISEDTQDEITGFFELGDGKHYHQFKKVLSFKEISA